MPPMRSFIASDTGRAGNITGIVAMVASMAAFVSNDLCVKLASARLPVGELIALRNTGATVYVALFIAVFGGLTWPKPVPIRLLSLRLVVEVFAAICFVGGLTLLPIGDATVLAQTTPIAITAAAAIYLKERPSGTLWLAIAIGFIGVLAIVRPGTKAFSPAALLILAGVGFVVLRDLATRLVPASFSTTTLTLLSTATGIISGLALAPFETWIYPEAHELGLLLLAGFCLTIGFAFTVIAMRNGEISVVSPFRYSIILFGLFYGWLFWDEAPDWIQIAGIGLLIVAGLLTIRYERTRRPRPTAR